MDYFIVSKGTGFTGTDFEVFVSLIVLPFAGCLVSQMIFGFIDIFRHILL